MSTSEFGYLVKTDSAVQYAADEPLDAISARTLMNNVCHLSDQASQNRVMWQDKTGTGPTPRASNVYLQILSWTFPVTLRQSGDAYLFRLRLGGFCSGTGTLRAIVGPPSLAGPASTWGITGDRVFTTAVLGSSDAWLTGTSGGSASPDLISLPAALVTLRDFPTTADFGGDPVNVSLPFVQLSIYGTTNDVTKPCVLTACLLDEFVGP